MARKLLLLAALVALVAGAAATRPQKERRLLGWPEDQCKQLASQYSGASQYAAKCSQCYQQTQDSGCMNVMMYNGDSRIVRDALNAIIGGAKGYEVHDYCEAYATSYGQFTECLNCLKVSNARTSSDAWVCKDCLVKSGGSGRKATACFNCNQNNGIDWGCSQCLSSFSTNAAVDACESCVVTKTASNVNEVYKCFQ